MQPCNIVWFRRDLRLTDNEIVSLATTGHIPTVFVFTLDPWFFKQAEIGSMRVKFLIESLKDLDRNLLRLGSRLTILSGESTTCITELIGSLRRDGFEPTLYFNRDIQVAYGLKRDKTIIDWCNDRNVQTHTGRSYFLLDDITDTNWHEQYYAYQSAKQWHVPTSITALPLKHTAHFKTLRTSELTSWVQQYVPDVIRQSRFEGGEIAAQRVLQSFLTERYHGYHWRLSRPWLAQQGATSQLSPHIAFGTISSRQVSAAAYDMKQRLKQDDPDEVRTIASFLSRVRWRDSFTQRLLLHPDIAWKNHYPEFDALYKDEPLTGEQADHFDHWKNGTTGFPLLDASMRELKQAGWLNFRMRAQAVTMLCIIFGVSWHHGARYFMQQLVDGDIAINHWQWQMQAGITNPLSPIFRIYDPAKNLRERDPKLQYVHYWLPELAGKDMDTIINVAQPIVDFNDKKLVNGTRISQLRLAARQRLIAENGLEYIEAKRIHEAARRVTDSYKRPRNPAQLSLFESGDA